MSGWYCYNEYKSEISNPYHEGYWSYDQSKSVTDGDAQTDKWTREKVIATYHFAPLTIQNVSVGVLENLSSQKIFLLNLFRESNKWQIQFITRKNAYIISKSRSIYRIRFDVIVIDNRFQQRHEFQPIYNVNKLCMYINVFSYFNLKAVNFFQNVHIQVHL